MRITDLLKKEGIVLNGSLKNKQDAIAVLVDLQEKAGNLSDKEEYKKGIIVREEMSTTAIGEGIAIPHAKNSGVKRAGLVAMTVPSGVDYDSMDGAPSNLFFMIAAPEKGGDVHLEVLSRLSTILMDESFRKQLLEAKTKEEFLQIIDKKEMEKFGVEEPEVKIEEEKQKEITQREGYRILAVTACPTGIAHTFMAAEALEQKGKEMGYSLKAETNGSGGAKNVLTRKEIEEADGIIIAADKNVDMARFEGKKVLKVKVADGIHKPEQLIQKIVDGNVPVYHHHGAAEEESSTRQEGLGRQIYKHLMNGVSHMLPFVIGGGILIALAFLLDDYSIDPANFGTNTPVAAWFKTIGGYAFNFMLPVLAAYIAMSIADRPGLLVGFVGGYIATVGSTFASPGGVDGGASGFLGAMVAGFAGGYFMLGLEKLCEKLPKALEGIKPVLIYPVGGVLMIGVIMCAIDPAVSWLNNALYDGLASMSGTNIILLGILLGGMMSVDMGGPVNKAAYVFGVASLSNQGEAGFMIMAAVMVGGMVPPIAIALATTFFKNRFTENERKSGVVNYIMGLCFISEGAIPYAAADPLRVIPSCVIGSAVAGGISMAMGCTLRAPHGGIFVTPVIGNQLGFLLALAIGSVVGMIMLAILKKPIEKKIV